MTKVTDPVSALWRWLCPFPELLPLPFLPVPFLPVVPPFFPLPAFESVTSDSACLAEFPVAVDGATRAVSVKPWPLGSPLGAISVVTVGAGAFEPLPAANAIAGATAMPLIVEMTRARVNARDMVGLLDLVVAAAGVSREFQRDADHDSRNCQAPNPQNDVFFYALLRRLEELFS
jgi:hypothetical protein